MSVEDNISKELQEISITLANINKANVFAVSDGYFKLFQEQLMHIVKASEDTETDELISVAPILASLPKTNPFQLPDQYTIQIDVNNIVKEKEIDQKKPLQLIYSIYQQYKPTLRIAASILLLIAATTWIYTIVQQNKTTQRSSELSQISEQEFNEFMLTETDEFPMIASEKEDVADNLFNIESGVNTLKEEELRLFLTEVPDYKTELIN